jgi:hypothetical protein
MPVGSYPIRVFPPAAWVERFDLPFSGVGQSLRAEVRNGSTVLHVGFTDWETRSAGKLIAGFSNSIVIALAEAPGLTWRLVIIDDTTLAETVYIEGAISYGSRANIVTEPDPSTVLVETPPTEAAAVARLGVGRPVDPLFALSLTGAQQAAPVALASGAINCAAGNIFTRSVGANITFSFSNVPATDAYFCVLIITYTAGIITWPAAVKWPDDLAPVLDPGVIQISMTTLDAGATWRAAGLYYSA